MIERSMLDAVVDRLANGEDVTVHVLDDHGPCRFLTYAASSAYDLGCRCQRCLIDHRQRSAAAQHRTRQRRRAAGGGR